MGELRGVLLSGEENNHDLLEDFQASPDCSSGKDSVKVKKIEWPDIIA
jgi:hypothetical protein